MNRTRARVLVGYVLCLLAAGGVISIYVLRSPGETVEVSATAKQEEFQRMLAQAEVRPWAETAKNIRVTPRGRGILWRLFPDKSRVVYTIRRKEDDRATALHFYDFAKGKASEVKLLARDEERALTLYNFLVSPDSKSIWLLIVPVGEWKREGHIGTWGGYWFRYDMEKGELVHQGDEYERLVDFTRGVGQDPPRAWPGPVWSFPDRKLYMSEQEARRAGVKRLWQNWDPLPRSSKIGFEGTLFEMISGMYKRGHVFVKGEYITSVTLASSWLPQNCWFVRDATGATLYKFIGHGKRGYWKSHLGERSILGVEDVPDSGVLVSSWDETSEFLDLIPFRMPAKGKQDVRARDSGSPGEGRTTETKAE